jgi:hypothetical protein
MSFPLRISLSFVKLLPYNIHVYLLIATTLKFTDFIRMESEEEERVSSTLFEA